MLFFSPTRAGRVAVVADTRSSPLPPHVRRISQRSPAGSRWIARREGTHVLMGRDLDPAGRSVQSVRRWEGQLILPAGGTPPSFLSFCLTAGPAPPTLSRPLARLRRALLSAGGRFQKQSTHEFAGRAKVLKFS